MTNGIDLRIDASNAITGTNVTTLADLSGNSRTLSGSMSVTDGLINGRRAFDFTGNRFMATAPFTGQASTSCVMVVVTTPTMQSSSSIALHFRTNGHHHGRDLGAGTLRTGVSNGTYSTGIAKVDNTPVILISTITNQGSNCTIRRYTTSATADFVDSIDGTVTGSSSSGPLHIGKSDNEYANCYIGELVYYNRVLTPQEIIDIQAYLRAKWF